MVLLIGLLVIIGVAGVDAKAELLSNSNLEVILSPHKDSGINLVISGNDAGELLRRGDYYKNGFGGVFKASIIYKNKNQIEGSVEIQDFRLKNAPVLEKKKAMN